MTIQYIYLKRVNTKSTHKNDGDVCGLYLCGPLVPSVPRALRLSIEQDDPPVIAAVWQAPRQPNGRLVAYRLRYGIDDDDDDVFQAEVRQLDAEKYRFTTGFLGQCHVTRNTQVTK